MHAIQIILFLLIAFIVLRIVARFRAKEMSAALLVSWIVFWAVAAVIVWRPELSTEIAQKMGVGRGADFIIYLALVALFYVFFRLSMRLEKQDRAISKIVQTLALRQGEIKDK